MASTHTEALTLARKLCRTLAAAPLPQKRAKDIFQALTRARGWNPIQERSILDFGAWLDGRPAPGAIKDRCEQLLKQL